MTHSLMHDTLPVLLFFSEPSASADAPELPAAEPVYAAVCKSKKKDKTKVTNSSSYSFQLHGVGGGGHY